MSFNLRKFSIFIIVVFLCLFLPAPRIFAQSGNDEKFHPMMSEIFKHQQELGLKSASKSRLQKIKDATFFSSLIQVTNPDGARERLLVRSLFDTTSPTVRKISLLHQGDKKSSFITTLDNEGQPFKQVIIRDNGQDFQVYDRPQDTFVYTQSKNTSGMASLKEWVYAREPNRSWGSEYTWNYSTDEPNKRIFLKSLIDGTVAVMAAAAKPSSKSSNPMSLLNAAMHSSTQQLAVLESLIYWTSSGEKKQASLSVIASNSECRSIRPCGAKQSLNSIVIKINEPISSYPLIIDPTLKYGQWMGGVAGAPAKISSTVAVGGKIYVGGYESSAGVVFDDNITMFGYGGGIESFIVEIQDGGTPVLNWGQWLGGIGTTTVSGIAISGSHILAGGYTINSNNWQSMSIQGTYNSSGTNQSAFVVEIQDGGTPALNWGQWLGGNGITEEIAMAISGSHVWAGGYTESSVSWQSMSIQGTYNVSSFNASGFVVEIQDGGTPVLNWGQWLGGFGFTQINSLAISGSNILAGGYTSSSVSWQSMSIQGTYNAPAGKSSGFIVEIQDGGTPALNWGQWLGGNSNTDILGMAISGSHILSAGYTQSSVSWQNMSIQGTYNVSATTESGFVVEVQDGGTPALNWGQWLGGNNNTVISGIAISGTHILVGGYTQSSVSWQSIDIQGTYNVSGVNYSGFVAEIQDGGTPALNWGQWLGGSNITFDEGIAISGSNILAVGYTQSSASWQTVSIQGLYSGGLNDGFVVEIHDGGTPSLNWGQFLGGSGETGVGAIQAIVANGNKIYVGGYDGSTDSFATVTLQGPYEGGTAEGFVVKIQDGGTPVLNWGQWLGGNNITEIFGMAISSSHILVGGFTESSVSWQSMSIQGTYNVSANTGTGFVAEIQDGGTPALNWGQWLGGKNTTNVNALAISGSHILVGGSTVNSGSWQSMSIQGTYNDTVSNSNTAFVVEMQDGGTPALNWGQWLGGAKGTIVQSIAISGSHILAAGSTCSSLLWQSMSIQGTYNVTGLHNSGYVVEIQDGGTPALNWGQWLGGNNSTLIQGITISGSHILVGGNTLNSSSWQSVTFQGTYGISGKGYVVEVQDGGTPSLNWGQWLGGSGSDQVMAIAISGSHIVTSGLTTNSASWESMSLYGTFNVSGTTLSGFVVEIQEGGTPSLNWGQWLGGQGNTLMNAIAIGGSQIYAGGYSVDSSNWQSVTFQGSFPVGITQDGQVVAISEPAIGGGGGSSSNGLFYGTDF
jgi:hypothetical protein